MYQMKALLSQLLRRFEILPAVDGLPPGINDHSREDCVPQSEYDPVLNIRVTLKSENGIQIRLRKRWINIKGPFYLIVLYFIY